MSRVHPLRAPEEEPKNSDHNGADYGCNNRNGISINRSPDVGKEARQQRAFVMTVSLAVSENTFKACRPILAAPPVTDSAKHSLFSRLGELLVASFLVHCCQEPLSPKCSRDPEQERQSGTS